MTGMPELAGIRSAHSSVQSEALNPLTFHSSDRERSLGVTVMATKVCVKDKPTVGPGAISSQQYLSHIVKLRESMRCR